MKTLNRVIGTACVLLLLLEAGAVQAEPAVVLRADRMLDVERGRVVSNAVVLLDREEGGKEKLAEDEVSLHSLLRAGGAADKLYQIGAITEDQLKTIKKQVKKK